MDYDSNIPPIEDRPLFYEILVKFTYLVGMIADQNFYDIFFAFFYPKALEFFRAEQSDTAEGENCAYGPTLKNCMKRKNGGTPGRPFFLT